jgi:signal transduction histidine kinase
VELKPVALEQLLENLIHQHPAFNQVQSSLLIERPLHVVLGHETYLTQCLTNLIENALKFVPGEVTPQVWIRSELIGGVVKVSVVDNGIGIPLENRDRLFQIFGRVHSDKRFTGTGIGLAIVKKAVNRMKGETGFDSELGKGSSFWLTLPQAAQNLSD